MVEKEVLNMSKQVPWNRIIYDEFVRLAMLNDL